MQIKQTEYSSIDFCSVFVVVQCLLPTSTVLIDLLHTRDSLVRTSFRKSFFKELALLSAVHSANSLLSLPQHLHPSISQLLTSVQHSHLLLSDYVASDIQTCIILLTINKNEISKAWLADICYVNAEASNNISTYMSDNNHRHGITERLVRCTTYLPYKMSARSWRHNMYLNKQPSSTLSSTSSSSSFNTSIFIILQNLLILDVTKSTQFIWRWFDHNAVFATYSNPDFTDAFIEAIYRAMNGMK